MNNKLENKIKDLKDMLTDLLVEKTEMLTIGYQELNASYSENLGKYEIYFYEREYEYAKLKRKIELIGLKHDKEDFNIDLYSLNKKVDEDYKDFRIRLNSRRKLASESETFMKDKLDLGQYSKMRKLYWNIARKIHPELSIDGKSQDRRAWDKVNRAFEEGDYYTIETYEISMSYSGGEKLDDDEKELEKQVNYLEKKIRDTQDYIESLAKIHPYNKKDILEDIEELKRKQSVIEIKTESVDKKISELENQMVDLLVK